MFLKIEKKKKALKISFQFDDLGKYFLFYFFFYIPFEQKGRARWLTPPEQ